MMQISASDVAKFKAALENYHQAQEEAQEEERIHIERERWEEQRQEDEELGSIKNTMSFVVIAVIIAVIYFGWENLIIIVIGVVGFVAFVHWGAMWETLSWVVIGIVALAVLEKGCRG